MLHLTYQGQYAGTTFCGTPRNETDAYFHGFGIGAPEPEVVAAHRGLQLCRDCAQVYMEVETDGDGYPREQDGHNESTHAIDCDLDEDCTCDA